MKLGKWERKILTYLYETSSLDGKYKTVRTKTIPLIDPTTGEIVNLNRHVLFSQAIRRLMKKGLLRSSWIAYDFKWWEYSRENIEAKTGPSDWYPSGDRPVRCSEQVSCTGFSIHLMTERKPVFNRYLELTEKGHEVTEEFVLSDL